MKTLVVWSNLQVHLGVQWKKLLAARCNLSNDFVAVG